MSTSICATAYMHHPYLRRYRRLTTSRSQSSRLSRCKFVPFVIQRVLVSRFDHIHIFLDQLDLFPELFLDDVVERGRAARHHEALSEEAFLHRLFKRRQVG